ncbi:hypothetical protein JOQ06_006578 [Pogonophryne albipinna]|uniref:Uncharacterized protein n=1 Tax=Pogonophryne albipinna TaxID=1090488 RepID=A0AAD6AZ60_9TELE|nr:hypothetical protein JOQ06_006578 [Pogonophryne albipinna]
MFTPRPSLLSELTSFLNPDAAVELSVLQRVTGELQRVTGELQRVTAELQKVTGELQKVTGELQRVTGGSLKLQML